MAISRETKEQQVSQLTDHFKQAKAVVLTHYHGLTVRDLQEFRKDLREQKVDYTVAKNNLFNLAAKNAGVKLEELEGPTAVAFGYEDPVQTTKAVNNFAKDHDSLQILGGIIDGEPADVATIKKLASLPGREELLGRLVGSLSAPTRNFAGALAGVSRNLVYALTAVKEQKA